jgi:hypothetical protein
MRRGQSQPGLRPLQEATLDAESSSTGRCGPGEFESRPERARRPAEGARTQPSPLPTVDKLWTSCGQARGGAKPARIPFPALSPAIRLRTLIPQEPFILPAAVPVHAAAGPTSHAGRHTHVHAGMHAQVCTGSAGTRTPTCTRAHIYTCAHSDTQGHVHMCTRRCTQGCSPALHLHLWVCVESSSVHPDALTHQFSGAEVQRSPDTQPMPLGVLMS